jgi:hypothetical protein
MVQVPDRFLFTGINAPSPRIALFTACLAFSTCQNSVSTVPRRGRIGRLAGTASVRTDAPAHGTAAATGRAIEDFDCSAGSNLKSN